MGCAPPKSYPPLDITDENYLVWRFNKRPLQRDVTRERVTIDGVKVDTIKFVAGYGDVGIFECVYPHKAGVRRHEIRLTLKGMFVQPIETFYEEKFSYPVIVVAFALLDVIRSVLLDLGNQCQSNINSFSEITL